MGMPGRRAALGLLATCALLGACGRSESRRAAPVRLEVDVLADTGRGQRLHIAVPAPSGGAASTGPLADVWLAHVAPARGAAADVPLPEATPDTVEDVMPAPPVLEVDPGLKPPILRVPGVLRVPPGGRGGFVEIDVRVAEDGRVSDALWAGGSRDSALVEAATGCALSMRFYPALRAGAPVAVWCRQRVDFARR
jgi:hypothetical protein